MMSLKEATAGSGGVGVQVMPEQSLVFGRQAHLFGVGSGKGAGDFAWREVQRVNLTHRSHLGGGATNKDFLRRRKLVGQNSAFNDLYAFLPSQGDDRGAL